MTSNRGSIPKEVETLLLRLLSESYIDLGRPDGTPRFLVDGATYDVSEEEVGVLKRWLDEVLGEE